MSKTPKMRGIAIPMNQVPPEILKLLLGNHAEAADDPNTQFVSSGHLSDTDKEMTCQHVQPILISTLKHFQDMLEKKTTRGQDGKEYAETDMMRNLVVRFYPSIEDKSLRRMMGLNLGDDLVLITSSFDDLDYDESNGWCWNEKGKICAPWITAVWSTNKLCGFKTAVHASIASNWLETMQPEWLQTAKRREVNVNEIIAFDKLFKVGHAK